MLCERCKKREASVIVRELVDGVQKQHSYCLNCATELNLGSFSEMEIPFAKLLSSLLGMVSSEEENSATEEVGTLTCPSCQMTYNEFLKKSHFGCADCYVTFGPLIEKNIKKLQAHDTHIGKRPLDKRNQNKQEKIEEVENEIQEVTIEEEIVLLQSRLKEALEEENYEAAATYRDKIRALRMKIE